MNTRDPVTMIKIIAVHPDVMSTPEGIREYLKDFGTARGRWLALVPSNWRKVVSQAIKRDLSLGQVKRNELRDKIVNPKFADRFLKIDLPDGYGRDWAVIVEDFCNKGLFDAAIVTNEHMVGAKSLVAHEFDPDSDLYAVKTSEFVARDPEELSRHVTPMLRFAKELHVIDVYCLSAGTNSKSYGSFFSRLLEWCRRNNPELRAITLHRRIPENFDESREVANYGSWLGQILQPGEKFLVRYLREREDGEKMHLRAVFTDRILVTGHYGFGAGVSSSETTDLALREHRDCGTIRDLYLSGSKIGFDLVHEIVIQGTE